VYKLGHSKHMFWHSMLELKKDNVNKYLHLVIVFEH